MVIQLEQSHLEVQLGQQEIAQMGLAFDGIKEQLESAGNYMQELTDRFESTKQEKINLEDKCGGLEERVEEKSLKIESLNGMVDGLRGDCTKYAQLVNDMTSEKNRMVDDGTELGKGMAELICELERLREESAKVTAANLKLDEERVRLMGEVQAVDCKNEDLLEENNTLDFKLAGFQEDNRKLA
jgi:chromosome segregation ATPase